MSFIKLSYWMYIAAAQVRGAWERLLGGGEGMEWRRWGLEQRDGTYCEVLTARGEVRKLKCWKGHNRMFRG